METPDNLEKSTHYTRENPRIDQIKPYMWKKGQSGNPAGRPKGKTLKEWTKDYLSRMTDEERDEFMQGIPKEVIWKMAEGNPAEDKKISVSIPKPILGGLTQGEKPIEIDYKDVIEGEVLENGESENTQ